MLKLLVKLFYLRLFSQHYIQIDNEYNPINGTAMTYAKTTERSPAVGRLWG